MPADNAPASDEERVRLMTSVIDEILDERWTDIERMWMQEIRPAFPAELSDEDFFKRVANPLTLHLLSIGLQAGIEGLTRHNQVFEKPFDVIVAPSGQVSILFRDGD